MIDNDVTQDDCRKEETEMATMLTAVKIAALILAISGGSISVLAASAHSPARLNTGLTCVILAGVGLALALLGRWIRTVLRDNRATRRALQKARAEIADEILKGQQQTEEAIKKSHEELARKADELNDVFAEVVRLGQDQLARKRLEAEHRMTRHN